ncbi:hypothetical protein Taro_020189 [Colocasia esculenta]|uniref:Uncharacterized protein n=1 Tax=Colocasia esculenta TaxID=4460 RepID=A0A843UYX3_COLES|nr:hypothetical protein [Colocasia esculenta]
MELLCGMDEVGGVVAFRLAPMRARERRLRTPQIERGKRLGMRGALPWFEAESSIRQGFAVMIRTVERVYKSILAGPMSKTGGCRKAVSRCRPNSAAPAQSGEPIWRRLVLMLPCRLSWMRRREKAEKRWFPPPPSDADGSRGLPGSCCGELAAILMVDVGSHHHGK